MLEIYYFSLSLLLVFIITIAFNALLKTKYPLAKERFKHTIKAPIVLGLWILYVYLISSAGLLLSFELPPNVFIFFFIPTILSITFFIRKYKNHPLMEAMPKSWTIYFQSFRIFVELIIWRTYLAGIFPVSMSFEGYNYEILVGLSAPIAAYLIFERKFLPEFTAIIWNFVGLIVLGIIIGIALTSAYFPHLWGASSSLLKIEFGMFPYTLLAGFLAPMAIFMHILSLSQLLGVKKS
jgi:hypothetical protein